MLDIVESNAGQCVSIGDERGHVEAAALAHEIVIKLAMQSKGSSASGMCRLMLPGTFPKSQEVDVLCVGIGWIQELGFSTGETSQQSMGEFAQETTA